MPVSVFGFIEGFTDVAQGVHNQQQILALPTSGAWLTAQLFSLVPQSRGHAYYGSHIHFAAGYKEFYCLDEEWILEFESLLSRLHWSQAELIVTWSKERYLWASDYAIEAARDVPNKIVGRSRFESAWDLKEIPWDS
jgi:hypothetical protein